MFIKFFIFRSKYLPTLVPMDGLIEDIFAGDGMSMAIAAIGKGFARNRNNKKNREIFVWGWNKHNMLFADQKYAKATIVKNPLPIKIEQLNLGDPGDEDTNNYEIALNLHAPGMENIAYHYKNNRMDKLQEHERKIDQLHLENFKLK